VSAERGDNARDDARDDDLVRRVRRGERRALEQLLHRHTDRVHAICRRIVGHPEDALDATQEALVAIARGIDRFDDRSQLSTWIHRVATNAALDEVRRKVRRPLPVEEVPAVARDGRTAAVDARLDVDAALATLAPEFRAAVVLRDLCDLDYAEIAEILDVPPGTVRSRIARGRAQLTAWFGEPTPSASRPTEEP